MAASRRGSAATTRQRKVSCPACGYTVRMARSWMQVGLPVCPCGESMRPESLADLALCGIIGQDDVPAPTWTVICRENGWEDLIIRKGNAAKTSTVRRAQLRHARADHCVFPGCHRWVATGAERCAVGHAQHEHLPAVQALPFRLFARRSKGARHRAGPWLLQSSVRCCRETGRISVSRRAYRGARRQGEGVSAPSRGVPDPYLFPGVREVISLPRGLADGKPTCQRRYGEISTASSGGLIPEGRKNGTVEVLAMVRDHRRALTGRSASMTVMRAARCFHGAATRLRLEAEAWAYFRLGEPESKPRLQQDFEPSGRAWHGPIRARPGSSGAQRPGFRARV
jgi:hypothetical protein